MPSTLHTCSVNNADFVPASELRRIEPKDCHDLIVVADNYKWIATDHDDLSSNSGCVYSSDGDNLYIWMRDEQKLIVQSVLNGMLTTTSVVRKKKNIKEKETLFMNNELDAIGMDDLTDLGNVEGPADLQQMDAFGSAEMQQPENGDIAPKIDFEASNSNYFIFMKQHGRFHYFITKTEAAVKVSKSKKKIMDANNRMIPDPTASLTPEEQKKYDETGKLPLAKALSETVISFKEAKPGAIVGGVISIPEGAQESASFITDILSRREVNFDQKKTDRIIRMLPKEQLYAAIPALFHGKIHEDENIMGSKASWLYIHYTEPKKKKKDAGSDVTGAATKKARPVLRLVPDTQKRTIMITDKNYVPLSVYQKASQQNLTEETAKGLNCLVESVIRNKTNYDGLAESSKKMVHWDEESPDAPVTSEYFKVGGPCAPISVTRFFDKTATLQDVLLPVKVKKENKKEAGKFTYSFVSYKLDDAEKGPMSNPHFRSIVESTGMSVDDFVEQASKLGRRGNGSKNKDAISVDAYLAAMQGSVADRAMFGDSVVDANELAKLLKGIA